MKTYQIFETQLKYSKRTKVNYLNSHIKKLGKEEQFKPKVHEKEGNLKCALHCSNRKQISSCLGWKLRDIDHKETTENILGNENFFTYFDGSGDYMNV